MPILPASHPSYGWRIGDKAGHWEILSNCHTDAEGSKSYLCKCPCGKVKEIRASVLFRGRSRSCGKCGLRGDGRSKDKLNNVWSGMLERCRNPRSDSWKDYGGRGITVCDEWKIYDGFRDWALANGYSPELQIDRRNNNEGYCPANCRWVTPILNQQNTRANRILTAFGESKCASEWVRDQRCVVCRNTLHYRLETGWSHEGAISTPPIQNRRDRVMFVRGTI